MLKKSENNGTEEIGLVTPNPGWPFRVNIVNIVAVDTQAPCDAKPSATILTLSLYLIEVKWRHIASWNFVNTGKSLYWKACS